jgi:hypothetical protein
MYGLEACNWAAIELQARDLQGPAGPARTLRSWQLSSDEPHPLLNLYCLIIPRRSIIQTVRSRLAECNPLLSLKYLPGRSLPAYFIKRYVHSLVRTSPLS